jgi:magnesium chelatase subunit D
MEDRLIGSVDIEESLKQGRTVFSPGILATAHRGILFVDDINLLDYEITNILLNAVKEGFVTVEREGVSMRYPCRPLLIATFNPEEGELKDHFLDRIGISLSAESGSFQTKERVQVVDNVFAFMEMNDVVNNPRHDGAGQSILTAAFREETDLTNSILFGRELVKDVEITHSQIQYLCEEAVRAGVQGHRGDICATEIAKANAILEGRIRVNAADLKLAVQLAIAPRGRWINTPNEEDGSDISPPSSQLPTSQLPTNDDMEGDSQQEQKPEQEEPEDMEEHQHQEDESESSEVETAAMPDIPKDFMFASGTWKKHHDDDVYSRQYLHRLFSFLSFS